MLSIALKHQMKKNFVKKLIEKVEKKGWECSDKLEVDQFRFMCLDVKKKLFSNNMKYITVYAK